MEFLDNILDKRVHVICNELDKLTVKQKLPLQNWIYKKGTFFRPEEADAASEPWENFDSHTMHWYGPDAHYWFRCRFTVPEAMAGKSMWVHVQTQIDEWDDGKNPQFLLFVNGKVTQGLDMNHRDVCLSKAAVAGEELTLDLQAYTGTLHSEFHLMAQLMEVDEEIRALYYDLDVPLRGFSRMERDDKVRRDLEHVLNEAVNKLDLRTPYSDAFYASVAEARAYLAKALYEDMAGYSDVIATCIGHTHIDVAWWWTVAQTREKVARSFATVLKLMDEYPGYRFMSSQPQLYWFLKQRYPEVYEEVRQRIKEKRWEPEGGMWVEADCNLTSGESLARQFLYGKKFFKEEFGVDNEILWLPDVFGYSGALPQIMKKAGIRYFMTTKLAWNQFNKVPYDTMMWRGIDGTEILTHLITTLGVGQSTDSFFTTYNGMLHPDAIMGGWMRYQNKDINNDILVAFGYGDGGGGPTRDMLETSIRMEKGIKGIPRVRQEFAGKYFEELEERVKGDKRLPVWEGEFYFEYHRGTYTSMARNKRSNRKSEFGLMDLELFSVLAQDQVAYPAQKLDEMWHTVLLNQFHDILPGSSIKEVYEVTRQEYAEIARTIDELTEERIDAITGPGEGITVYNTTGFERDDLVVLGDCGADYLEDEFGNRYPVQKTSKGAQAFVYGIPSKGSRVFAPGAYAEGEKAEESPFTWNGSVLETPYYRVSIDENGLFTGMYDKEFDREILQEGKCGNLFRMYEDKPIYYDNWDIDIYYTEKSWDVTDVRRMEWKEMGPVRCTLYLERAVSNSLICQEISFYADTRRIDFETKVDWKEHQHLLKVHFPVDVHTDEATFDIQFGNITRKTHTNTSWDAARFESCGQKWIDVSEGHYGVSLMNDCKYGHSVRDSIIGLTLIKSGIEPNPTTDQEEHFFTYSLYPHGETWREAGTVKQSYFLNQPMYVAKGGEAGEKTCLVSVDQPNVVIETVKRAEDGDGMIVRLYESDNARTKAVLTVDGEILSAEECNLLEEKEGDMTHSGSQMPFVIKPYEIKTYRIRR
ncbi:MAG TPA: alpha-mannosidase [Candidatus Limivivens intestinipullorum]|uniref:Alpha-mannosidase n=1 Tax=Candidatus Limivivens intestinipullorum TaxID=2840858 RepID=A0A9D1ETH1_9FIRM|nr:alpha-mannosidase [Candidatus Limivivens intestinipullorum]